MVGVVPPSPSCGHLQLWVLLPLPLSLSGHLQLQVLLLLLLVVRRGGDAVVVRRGGRGSDMVVTVVDHGNWWSRLEVVMVVVRGVEIWNFNLHVMSSVT